MPGGYDGATGRIVRGSEARSHLNIVFKVSPAELESLTLAHEADPRAESVNVWARDVLMAFGPDLGTLRSLLQLLEWGEARAAGARETGVPNPDLEGKAETAREAVIAWAILAVSKYERPGR